MPKTKLPPRLSNWKLSRARFDDELEWFRPTDFEDHDLPHPIILVNGAFDLLHFSHMKLIWAARAKATEQGTVIVALDSDHKVRARKGEGHPVWSFVERATAMSYMPVDGLVEIDHPSDFKTLLTYLQPDLRVQGYDYINHPTAHPSIPKLFVRDGGIHTSEIIRRCQSIPPPSL